MAYYHDQPGRYEPYDYSRHGNHPSPNSGSRLTEMANSANPSGHQYSSYGSYGSYDPRYASNAAPPPLPRRSSAQAPYRTRLRRSWPPSPSAEDERVSLRREVSSGDIEDEYGDEAIPRGTVDQYPIIEEVERPKVPETTDDRRYVLVSEPNAEADSKYDARDRRRKSFAERGNLPHINTGADDPPLFTERISMPYAYTKPQKESLAPSAGEYTLSPESLRTSASAVPRSVPNRDARDAQRDQNTRPQKTVPIRSRYDSLGQSPKAQRHDVFEDSDTDDGSYLRTDERKPARYSFVKSELNKDDLRTSLRDHQAKAEKRPSEKVSSRPSGYDPHHSGSSSSSKVNTPGTQSPRSSNSSVHNGPSSRRRERPSPVETSDPRMQNFDKRPPSRPHSPLRPSSPLHYGHLPSPPQSPKPMQRPADYPPSPRPSSRSGTPRTSSPLSSSAVPPPVPPKVPVTEADWRSTYPPVTANDRSRTEARFSRHETMPTPAPRIGIQSPSPARPPKVESPLPYPVDDRPNPFFMPQEEIYQFDHSNTPTSPSPNLRSPYSESPRHSRSPIPGSPRERPGYTFPGPSASRYTGNAEELEPPRSSRVRSSSIRSQASSDGRRADRRAMSLDRPMPSCPRSSPSSEHDWYTLEGCDQFDVCPSCYEGVFADTPFSDYFKPVYRSDARFCDFSTPWMRLAWLLTIKQQRKSPDLLYQLATVTEYSDPCPKDREVSNIIWYGIPDPRDGIHVANFAVCPSDLKMVETLCPSIRGYMTPLPSIDRYGVPTGKHFCSLRTSSKRFPKYLDLLVELDAEAQLTSRPPDIGKFIKLAREHAFKSECARDKTFTRRPWHFIPSLPEFTVCEECFDEVVYPAIRSGNSLAKLFRRRTQLVPNEDENLGTSCSLYSPRMRRVWERACEDGEAQGYAYLKRKAGERKRDEKRLMRERRDLERWLDNLRRGGGDERELGSLRKDLRAVEREWGMVE